MPTLADYARLAPFTLEELVDAANSLLRERPRLHVTPRTVRYYISQDVLPSPSGPPRFARYGQEHLMRLVGLRLLQDEGKSLEEASGELDRILASPDAQETVQRRLREPAPPGLAGPLFVPGEPEFDPRATEPALTAPKVPPSPEAGEHPARPARLAHLAGPDFSARPQAGRTEATQSPFPATGDALLYRRIALTPDATLEIRAGDDAEQVLRAALEALERRLRRGTRLRDSS